MMSTAKEKYRAWCATEPGIPLFSRDWWLDAVCFEGEWAVILIEVMGEIIASLPYYLKRKGPFSLLTMPPLTQTMGPHIKYPEGLTHPQKINFEKKILSDLIARLPTNDHTIIACHHSLTNWLPFYWAGFRQTTYYTYTVDLADLQKAISDFATSKQRDLRKARGSIHIDGCLSGAEFYEFHKRNLAKRHRKISYSSATFGRIYDAACSRNAASVIGGRDADGSLHAAAFIVWGPESAYYLVSSFDPEFRNSGSSALVVEACMRQAAQVTGKFDFEGSMVEEIEAAYRRFGGVQTPYFLLTNTASRFIRFRQAALSAFGRQ